MAKYTFTCQQGHEPMVMEVEAGSDDEAMAMMMEKAKAHLGEHHADMPMDDEKMKAMIMDPENGWKKEEMAA